VPEDEIDGRLPPHDFTAEMSVLGGLLSGRGFAEVAVLIGPSDYYRPGHQVIHEAVVALAGQGKPYHAVAVADELRRRGQLERVGGGPYLHTLVAAASPDPSYDAGIVAATAFRRRRIEELTRTLQLAWNPSVEPAAVDDAVAALAETGMPGAGAKSDRLGQLRAALLDSDALDSIPAPQPVIDGFLYRDSLAWLHGKPGNGKSFVALDWAACVASGLPWQEHETAQGPVLYVAAEGKSGLRPRVRAWEDYAQCVMAVRFLPVAVQLLMPVDIAALAAVAADMGPVLVVLDTQARVTTGFDENSAKDMGLFVAAADRLREATGACVLTVHHEARAGENMRGSTALEGAATSIMRASKEGSLITLSTSKQKDAPEAEDVRLTLMPRLASAVLMSHGRAGNFGLLSDSEGTVLGTLRELFVGRSATPTEIIDTSKLSKSTVYRALSSLVSKGKLINAGTEARPRYVLTESELPSIPRTSQVAPPKLPTSHHPFRGGTNGKPGEADGDAWPADTIGDASNEGAS
jgi:AAA domain/DnaB-like helicase N terminal domain